MSKRVSHILSIVMALVLFIDAEVVAQANVTISGTIRDSQSGDPLPAASVILSGTGFGAASDADGKYVIRNVIAGSYTLRASYVGYKTLETQVEVKEGEDITKDLKLEAVGVQGEVVVVTAQARGQKEAINEQLASDRIMNAVSSSRIQELPDANAAEAVGRLPGVSVTRNGGEGNAVVVRGLQPKYNAITVDGVRMSSTNANDRSVDLSMISPNMLEGIEVSKTVTPDRDADVIGGTVNFKMREAKGGKESESGLGYDFLAQGGYTGLSNAYNKFNNYKYVGSVEGRFFDEQLGIFAQADLERRNLSSNEFGATYSYYKALDYTHYLIQNASLSDIPRDRQRVNGSLVLDYKLPEGKISLINFLSSGVTEIQNRGESYDIVGNNHDYSFAYSNGKLKMLTNALAVEHQVSIFHVDAKISNTYSQTNNPEDWTISFRQTSADPNARFAGQPNVDPRLIPKGIPNDSSKTFLTNIVTNSSFFVERAFTASLDIDTRVNVSDLIITTIKFGGKYRLQSRSYDYDQYDGQGLSLASSRGVDDIITARYAPQYVGSTSIPLMAFLDPSFKYGTFLDGDFTMYHPTNAGVMSGMAHLLRDNAAYIASINQSIAYGHDDFQSRSFDYSGDETMTAFYVMGTINVGPDITIIPGVRYQNLKTTYSGVRGQESPLSYNAYAHYDTTTTLNHGYWLPDASIRYKPLSWCDVRLSYSNTLAYPDYNAIIPRIDVANGAIAWNNYKLEPSRSTNYDVYVSFYDNAVGLFTAGGFLKQITNLIYGYTFYAQGTKAWNYFPSPYIDTTAPPSGSYSINTFVNNPYRINVSGFELDWQTHFWYLPDPLTGLVLGINYTHTYSKGEYPYTDSRRVGRTIVYVDTSFADRLLSQPNNIVNLSLGYDYKDFSVRVSMLYQADIFSGVTYWPQNRTTTAAYKRWDISLKQKLPWFGVQLYGDINNINGARDMSVLQMYSGIPQSAQSYGMTADIGIRWIF